MCKIIENSSLFAYNKITEQTTFGNFKKIIDDFKDPKYEVRYAVGELINQFNHLLKNRDYKTKYSYEQMIYFTVEEAYKTHLKENNDAPNNLNIVLGFIEVLRKIANIIGSRFEAVNNFNTIKDYSLKQMLFNKNGEARGIVGKTHAKITNIFEKIAQKTVLGSDRKTGCRMGNTLSKRSRLPIIIGSMRTPSVLRSTIRVSSPTTVS